MEFWFIWQSHNAFNYCEFVLGWRAGWFPDHGNRRIQNISSWFLVWAENHTGVCKDHLDPPISPGIAFSKPLIPQSSRSRWEQKKNSPKVLGEDGEPSLSLQLSPHCCWPWDTALGLLSAPQTNPIPNWNHQFLPFSPWVSQHWGFSVLPKQIQFQTEIIIFALLPPSQWQNKAGFRDFSSWGKLGSGRCGIATSLLQREFSVPHFGTSLLPSVHWKINGTLPQGLMSCRSPAPSFTACFKNGISVFFVGN